MDISTPESNSGNSLDRTARLELVQKKVIGCDKCPALVENRTNTVFGRGDPNAKIIFIGEGPGADEDKQGIPFIGRAGKLLDNIIGACGLKSYYIMNVLKCRPPGNRDPLPEEAKNCRPFFDLQLKVLSPEYLICLGKVAASTVLSYPASTPMYVYREDAHEGFHQLKKPIRAKVIATWHPAYALRNPQAKKDMWEDLQPMLREIGNA